MKQEDKAKRYDEVIEQLRAIMPNWENLSYNGKTFLQDLVYIIPELKESEESENERIRKDIVFYIAAHHKDDGEKARWLYWLEKQGILMKALQISNANIGKLIEENYYLKEQVEKQGENNTGISEATKQKLEDNLNNALEKETPESWNKFLDEQGEQKPVFEMKSTEESLGIDSETYNKIVDECIYGEQTPTENKGMNLAEEDMTPFQKKVFCIIDTAIEEEQGLKQVCDELLRLAHDEIKQKPNDKIEPKFKVGDSIKTANEEPLTITEVSDRGYWSEDLFICSFDDAAKWELVEQKPAWSKKDEKMKTRCAAFLGHNYQGGMMTRKEYKEAHNWLESLKGRVQTKQEWNEEDEIKETIRCALLSCCNGSAINYKLPYDGYEKCLSWLKSLRPQSQ